jgi:hypothetical protein
MKTYEDEAFDELEKSLQRKIATGVTDGSKKDVALKQALKALEDAKTHGFVYVDEIVDLRQAIEFSKKQGEPVAWEYCEEVFWHTNQNLNDYIRANGTPLYTTPQQRTEQNFCQRCGKRTKDLTHIHTCTPPQEKTHEH